VTPAINVVLPPARARGWTTARRVASLVILLLMAAAVGLVASFGLRLRDTATGRDLPSTAVVFTGQFDRIETGLALLAEGRIDRLFISGVNAGAGLSPEGFARQFELSDVLKDHLAAGRIILATAANTTVENGCETAQWLSSHPDVSRVLLITSRPHMPRAALVLARATQKPIRIARLSVDAPAHDTPAVFLREFFSFTKTLLMPLLPPTIRPDDRSGPCRPG
jgi:uncharacterized SAM-binding protein YcdF (DUF218 family)